MSTGASVLSVLDAIGHGGVMLDANGRVLQTNQRAQRYLGGEFDVRRRSGSLRDVGLLSSVQDGLRRALAESAKLNPRLGEYITVPRRDMRPLLLRSIIIEGEGDGAGTLTAVIVLDMEDCPLPDAKLLHDLFLLTPAETRLARKLTCGQSLAAIAEELGLGRGTLRTQLQMLFMKTGTRRQGRTDCPSGPAYSIQRTRRPTGID